MAEQKSIMGMIDGEVTALILKYGIGKIAHPSYIDSIAATFEDFIKESGKEDSNMGIKAKELNDSIFNRQKIIQKITSALGVNS